jgi:hypothetical protein
MNDVLQLLAGSAKGNLPFKTSKLTKLLENSLTGGAKTVMIATISAAPT